MLVIHETYTLLIRMDYPTAHEAVFESISEPQDCKSPRAILTPFDWSIVGPLSYKWKRTQQRYYYRLATNDSTDSLATEQLLDEFFNSDLTCALMNDDKAVSPDEKCAWKIPKESTRFDGESESWTAMELERRLNAHPELGARYTTVLKEYISAGHARRLSPDEILDWRAAPGGCHVCGDQSVQTVKVADCLRRRR
uniref:Uncharacterized protein n=1 Tax=Trichuris muris TaxID=70415 RepID=A0A5S6QM30_TRIMR